MGDRAPLSLVRALALGVPAALLAGAYIGQYLFDLYPCEMCWWQRYPHFAAIGLALMGVIARPKRFWFGLAALSILSSGLIGAFHAGVEYGWWEGLTACSSPVAMGSGDPLEAVLNAPLVRCDDVQWSLFGISLAGWNFLISTAAAVTIIGLLFRGAAGRSGARQRTLS
ncbi:disulfide bond formation protein [Croceicoccus estronivorus]|uniref:disulfide bond formation protein B n=1 Tax=Croceicoccus estronivorus TaxID=1172626 RepID=UPI00082BB08F|nr:disulfide bond formation protein B [Croceicoccus estronivorus]OCC24029.1 disulfide bond formation protein [Croceicoccus estronivorus]